MDTTPTPFGDWLKKRIKEHGNSTRKAALYIGVADTTLHDIIRKGAKPGPETIWKIAAYFHVEIDRLYGLAGYRPEQRRYPVPEMDVIIERATLLPADQQRRFWRQVRGLLDLIERVPEESLPDVGIGNAV